MGVTGAVEFYSRYKCHYPNNRVNIAAFAGGFIIIDAFAVIYRWCSAQILQSHVESGLQSYENNTTNSELLACIKYAILCMNNGVVPIFVFDGKVPKIKKKKPLTAPQMPTKNKFKANYNNVKNCVFTLALLGIPTVVAPNEADSQCAALAKYFTAKHVKSAVLSDDFDVILFGCKTMLRLSSLHRNTLEEYTEDKMLHALAPKCTSLNNLIDICILMGTDYTNDKKYKLAYILEHPNINELLPCDKKAQSEYTHALVKVPNSLDLYLKKPYKLLAWEFLSRFLEQASVDSILNFVETFYTINKNETTDNNYDCLLSYRQKYLKQKYGLSCAHVEPLKRSVGDKHQSLKQI